MGFDLVKTEVAPAPEGGWARHLFYDTGGGECLAIWDLHDDPAIPDGFDPSISRGLGLPSWTNHLAFDARDLETLDDADRRSADELRRAAAPALAAPPDPQILEAATASIG
jgi:hypothetical protein